MTAARPRAIPAAVPASANRYSICSPGVRPVPVSAATCDGTTQASALRLIERAVPTTVSRGLPGRSGNSSSRPSRTGGPSPPAARTISPGARTQRPSVGVSASTGPSGAARPTTVSGGPVRPARLGVTDATGNGPDASARAVSRSRACVTRPAANCAVRWAPCCRANAWSKGASDATSSAPPSTDEVTASRVARPTTSDCTRRRAAPARTKRPSALIGRAPHGSRRPR
ncbi:hypothetical protein [Streptomyces griseoruber]|uniref:hypothetical protein n=1 Tax=Streptomyces griseoruber TaxID=1943 RepID=UPI00378DCA57